jgi:predicted transcriptional regulator of viral defense system
MPLGSGTRRLRVTSESSPGLGRLAHHAGHRVRLISSYTLVMSDRHPDQLALHRRAFGQDGFFTAEQARERGFSPQLLAHHVRAGRYERVRRGLYRLAGFPGSGSEEVRAKWMTVGADRAVVSHESALELHDLSDVMPNAVHLLVEREDRGIKPPPGVVVHTTSTPCRPEDLTTVDGIRATSPARAILDAAAAGMATDQVVMALRQALDRGLVDSAEIQAAAEQRSGRVRELVRTVIAQVEDR